MRGPLMFPHVTPRFLQETIINGPLTAGNRSIMVFVCYEK